MVSKQNPGDSAPETKIRIPAWLYPSTLELLDQTFPKDNCKTRSEFIEKAVKFYGGYISGQEATAYLPTALVSALQGTLQSSESRNARLLFKLSVEVSMMMNIFAAAIEINADDLDKLRARCVQEVKKINGSISLKDAVEYQRGSSQ